MTEDRHQVTMCDSMSQQGRAQLAGLSSALNLWVKESKVTFSRSKPINSKLADTGYKNKNKLVHKMCLLAGLSM